MAARLLAHTDVRIQRIAALTCFSQTSFWTGFKEWSGRTPGEYREKPDQDPYPWCPVIDRTKVLDALEGRLSRQEGFAVCLRLYDHLLDTFAPDVDELLRLIDNAIDTADYEVAVRLLERAAEHPERGAYPAAIDQRLAVVSHSRGTIRTRKGDVDRAYEDLALARTCYAQAGVLEPRLEKRRRRLEGEAPCSTDQALTSALCPDCRRAYFLDVGATLRGHLRRALELVPLDLEWFRVCCDDCYRVMWEAFKYARHGLLNDAYKAFWLARNVDLQDPAAPKTVGRVIAALSEVDSFRWSSQEDRLKMCELAVGAAEGVGRPELLTVTRFWEGLVHCALADFSKARSHLRWKPQSGESPWLSALHESFSGALEHATTNYENALDRLQSAAGLFQGLDPHGAGMAIYQQGRVRVDLHEFEEGIQLCRRAVRVFDERRDSFPSRVAVPITVATALAQLGRLEQSAMELNQCSYDRDAYPAVAAVEVFNIGCIAMLAGKAQKAMSSYEDAKRRFERLGHLSPLAGNFYAKRREFRKGTIRHGQEQESHRAS